MLHLNNPAYFFLFSLTEQNTSGKGSERTPLDRQFLVVKSMLVHYSQKDVLQ